MPEFSFPEYDDRVIDLSGEDILPLTPDENKGEDKSQLLSEIAEIIRSIKSAPEEELLAKARELHYLTRRINLSYPSHRNRLGAHKIANLFQVAIDAFKERGLTHENEPRYLKTLCMRIDGIRSGGTTTEERLLGGDLDWLR